MTSLRATFHFEVRGLCVARELLGTTHELRRGDHRVRITLPTEDRQPQDESNKIDPSIFPDADRLPLMEGGGYGSAGVSAVPSEEFASIDALRAEVVFDDDVNVENYADRVGGDDWHIRASKSHWDAMEVARDVVAALVSWIRVRPGQQWLGLSGEEVWPVGRSGLEDLDAARTLPYGFSGGRVVFQKIDDRQIVDAAALQAALRSMEADEPPELPATVLADAIFLHMHPRDAPRVILTAAIACELKVKQALRDRATAETGALLDVLLENPRDYSVAARDLFDRPMAAVAGDSLRLTDRALWKQVSRLFEIRNAIAHRGYVPTEEEADAAIEAAAGAFRWLNALARPA